MDILEQAQNIQWKEAGEKIMSGAREVGIEDIDLNLVETLRYFDITSSNQMDKETIRKIQFIHKNLKTDDALSELRAIDSKLGKSANLANSLDKIYSHFYTLGLEKGFEKEKKLEDRRTAEKMEAGRKELETRESQKRREKLLEHKRSEEQIRRDMAAKRRQTYLENKEAKELDKRMEAIKKAPKPKPPPPPEVIL